MSGAARGTFVATTMAAAFIAIACGGSKSSAPPPSSPAAVPVSDVAATVTAAAGGTVSFPNGPTLRVPPNAVAADTVITIHKSDLAAPAGALSALYELGPAGTVFAAPLTVTMPLPAGTAAATVYLTKLSRRPRRAPLHRHVPESAGEALETFAKRRDRDRAFGRGQDLSDFRPRKPLIHSQREQHLLVVRESPAQLL